MRPASCAATSAAVTGEGPPERFALVVASGAPASRINSRARSWSGMRTATVSPPAVTSAGTRRPFGTTSVSAPGQKALAEPCRKRREVARDERKVLGVGKQDRDGFVEAAQLGGVKPGHRRVVPADRADAVHGVRGKGNQLARAQEACGRANSRAASPEALSSVAEDVSFDDIGQSVFRHGAERFRRPPRTLPATRCATAMPSPAHSIMDASLPESPTAMVSA